MIEFSGIEFRHVDNRLMSLKLVQLGLSQARHVRRRADVLQPTECCTQAGARPARTFSSGEPRSNIDMLKCARAALCQGAGTSEGDIVESRKSHEHLLSDGGPLDLTRLLAAPTFLGRPARPSLVSD